MTRITARTRAFLVALDPAGTALDRGDCLTFARVEGAGLCPLRCRECRLLPGKQAGPPAVSRNGSRAIAGGTTSHHVQVASRIDSPRQEQPFSSRL